MRARGAERGGAVATFLTIYTPTYKRPTFLALCVESVEEQTIRAEIQHIVVEDLVGVGIEGMFAEIPAHLAEFEGEYVYVLQDDDRLAAPDVVQVVKQFVRQRQYPEVVMVKSRKGGGRLPTYWGERPVECHVDLGNYVVRCDVFRDHVSEFGSRYNGDFDFIDGLWTAGHRFEWCDVMFARAMARGLGRPESDLEMEVLAARERAVGRRMR